MRLLSASFTTARCTPRSLPTRQPHASAAVFNPRPLRRLTPQRFSPAASAASSFAAGSSEREQARQALLQHIAGFRPNQPQKPENQAEAQRRMACLTQHSSCVDALQDPELFCRTWKMLYTTQPFGRYLSLDSLSFNQFPKMAVEVHDVYQVVEHASRGYTNVVEVTLPADAADVLPLRAHVLMRARFAPHSERPGALAITFYEVAMMPADTLADSARFIQRFGASELHKPLNLGKMDSWITTPYLDSQTRISAGNLGGTFVLEPSARRFAGTP